MQRDIILFGYVVLLIFYIQDISYISSVTPAQILRPKFIYIFANIEGLTMKAYCKPKQAFNANTQNIQNTVTYVY